MRDASGLEAYRKFSFEDVYRTAKSIANYFIQNGVNRGDKVAILSENRPEWGMAFLATTALGAVAIPLDAQLTTEELLYIIGDSGARLIVISSALFEKHKFDIDTLLMEEIPELPKIDIDLEKYDKAHLAAIVYTSGTTGNPKGVMLSHENIVTNFIGVTRLFKIGPGDNFLSILPLHHMFECTAGFLAPFYTGASITYAESLKSYNILRNMKETKVTIMCGVPLLYSLLYDGIMREVESGSPGTKAIFKILLNISQKIRSRWVRKKLFAKIHEQFGGHIRFFVSGGASIDPEIIKHFELFGFTVLQGYGLTESSPILTCNNLENNRVGSVGRAIENVEIKLGEDNEIVARGPNIMQGYYKRPDLTAEVIKDGWLYTGDQGRIDADGYVYITGRLKDIIVSGAGVNVYPEEIEFFLNKIDGVKEACVLGFKIHGGVRDGMEDVMAVVVPDYEYFGKHKKHLKQSDIEEHINSEVDKLNCRMAPYKRISKIKIRSIEFPKTSTRKIRRFQVKKEMGI